ncbi:MAG: beta-galactosidase [Clostridiales bacterium]|nr:beta-galactosidase [Clostridiales bacterium]
MRCSPIIPKIPHFLHGGDYNPEQWIPWKDEIWPEDVRLMKLAEINVVSIGIFSWAALEPEEGRFTFEWLDDIMDMLHANGVTAILAAPSGARPVWMARKYPEILRVRAAGGRNLFGGRHNHCWSSPVYREKVRTINAKLAERYKDHPALGMWHVSNEYSGDCHCENCQEAFRDFLRKKYGSLDALNTAYWSAFWSHTYFDWDDVEPPSPVGETSVHGLSLDWMRFTTEQAVDFYMNEIAPLKAITPGIPCTTNLMGTFFGLDYFRLGEVLDVVSWDNYPSWGNDENDDHVGCLTAFSHDLMRGCGRQKPFLLMESSPSATNWQRVAKLRRPGVHLLSSMQAVAHGSDSVQYFQFRQSRGAAEKFHGAAVQHAGHEHTRVFRDVREVGQALLKIDCVRGSSVKNHVAIIYDWPNRWALSYAQGMLNGEIEVGRVTSDDKGYLGAVLMHYRAFWERGVGVDIIDSSMDPNPYSLVVAPMLYMLRPSCAERLEAFVRRGGRLVTTYMTGYADENDLCFLGGFPGPLRNTAGVWAEEIDALKEGHYVSVLQDGREYKAFGLCEIIHADKETQVLASYGAEFYAGSPALTNHPLGNGSAYHMAARMEQMFLNDFYAKLTSSLDIKPVLPGPIPAGVSVTSRTGGKNEYVFVLNLLDGEVKVNLERGGYDLLNERDLDAAEYTLPGHGLLIFSRII